MSQKALYMWAFAVVIMFLRSGPALFAGDRPPEFLAFIRANAVSGSLDVWSYLCMAAAIYLGATSIASELRAKTIITVLSHPIRRWEMLIGKWIGVSAFCIVTLGIGVALAYGLSRYLDVTMDAGVLAISVTRTVVGIVLFTAIATAVSTTGSAPVAVAITMFVAIVPQLIEPLRDDPSPTYHRIGVGLDALVPPGYESNYDGVVWAPLPMPQNVRGTIPPTLARLRNRPEVDFAEQRKQTAQTAAYAGVYFLLGCVLFTRRDLKFS
jgi:ABC-type Na+ efflux pump permease subunit